MCRMTPGPCSSGNSNTCPGASRVMSMLPSFQFGCSLLEMRRLRPDGGAASPPRRSLKRDMFYLLADPGSVVHVRRDVLIGEEAVAAVAAGVPDQEGAAARKRRVIPVSD